MYEHTDFTVPVITEADEEGRRGFDAAERRVIAGDCAGRIRNNADELCPGVYSPAGFPYRSGTHV